MLVDVYEKTRTIEVPDGDKTVKVCKIDLTGLGYSQEVEIQQLGNGFVNTPIVFVGDTDGEKILEYINNLKASVDREWYKRRNFFNSVDQAYDLFCNVIKNTAIKDKVKTDLLRSMASCFSGVKDPMWRM
jgi:hypothetical protein